MQGDQVAFAVVNQSSKPVRSDRVDWLVNLSPQRFDLGDRVADATGIPIDPGPVREMRYGIGKELGMDHLTPEARSGR